MEIAELKQVIRDIPDFPSPGILFKDITPLLQDPVAMSTAVRGLSELSNSYDVVAGVEARGFIFGAAIAQLAHKGFVPIRKSGKLPYSSYSESYALEYGESTLQIHTDSIKPGQRVLIVDDVLATGGTLTAAIKLVERCGGVVDCLAVLMEIAGLGGAANLESAYPEIGLQVLISE
jgi:adenine phosphoribosyltransferase